ncbi:MAG: D-glycero-beta-D-manno-heptose 1-phosphate adenylyltransferase [Deltaproteobacteria bacterium]|nr:D-glycero-beta-D-manno-heptose 1-phosphate adenylyltransferase [Deltaproteobacteria bacterium]MBW2130784.1 D-glycero-beta-D-manno-heptose 1-phosphate adenylyltransferase [Deltaproteobacteria bacterium]MBW2302695.1 D-glycero-beta-D-manno-heptose 1-phosphate adenylyltransferase [Deltaproteobacteria bacterium]
MESYLRKIKSIKALGDDIGNLKGRGKRIVFTNGCFDLLHRGHVRYLSEARKLGDYLIVAVNSDRSVRAIKGPGRPVMPEEERAELLSALEFVDAVTLFDEETPLEVIRSLMPDVLVKGGDWPVDKIIGGDLVIKAGGEVRSIPFVSGHSTTEIIRRIRDGSPPGHLDQ